MSSLTLQSSGSINVKSALVLDTALPITGGGTGSTSASDARTALGLAIGSDVQAYHAKLADISGLAPSNGQVISWDGSNFVASAAGSYTADGVTLQLTGSEFAIKDGGVDADAIGANAVTSAKLHSSVASTGISFNSGALQVDSTAVCMLSGGQTVGGVKTLSDEPVLQSGLQHKGGAHSGSAKESVVESQSTDGTTFTLASVAVASNAMLYVSAEVAFINGDGADVGAFRLHGVAKNLAGTSSSLQLNDEIVYRSDASITCVLDVDDTSDVVRVRCNGNSKTVRWHCKLRWQSVPFYSA